MTTPRAIAAGSTSERPALSPELMLEWACRVHTDHMVHRYLLSNSKGRLDGAEKALRHLELCAFYVAVVYGYASPEEARQEHHEAWLKVHTATQALTDYLDEQIGFPLDCRPDYDLLAPKFFKKFHALAMQALAPSERPGA